MADATLHAQPGSVGPVAGKKAASRTVLGLALVVALLILARIPGYFEPLEPDIVTYATMGRELAAGERLYTDNWDVKPPGLYATYALGASVAHGAASVFVLGLSAALVTLAAVVWAGWVLGPASALYAALLWGILNGTLALQANQPNSEVFINALCALGVALLVTQTQNSWLRAGLAGLCFALASTYKPVAVFAAAFIALVHVLFPPGGVSRRRALADAGLIALVGGAVWGGIFLYASATGQGAIYWATNITANGSRSGGILFNLFRYLRELRIFPLRMLFLLPLVLLVTAGALKGMRSSARRPWALLIAWALSAHCMIFSQGTAFHPHTYQFWLPILALGGGWVFGSETTLTPLWRRVRLALVFGILLLHEVPHYLRSPERWALEKYGPVVVEDQALGKALGQVLEPPETVFQFGNGAAVFFYSGLRPSTPTLWSSHLFVDTHLTQQIARTTLQALQAQPPEVFLVQPPSEWLPSAEPAPLGLAARLLGVKPVSTSGITLEGHPIYQWAMANYRPLRAPEGSPLAALQSTRMAVYVRAGGRLERQLSER